MNGSFIVFLVSFCLFFIGRAYVHLTANRLSPNAKKSIAACSLMLISVVISSGDAFGLDETPKYRILVLHSYYQGYKWTDDENAGIESVLQPVMGRTNLYIEYMDTKKIFGDLYSQRLFEVYKLKYENFKFDVIITTDNNAFYFMQTYRDTLFPGTPVVFCGVNNFQESDLKGHRLFTGINEDSDLRGAIDMILKLHPKTRHIFFINEWTSTGQKVHDEFMAAIPHFMGSVSFTMLENVEMETLLNQLDALPRDSAVLYTSFSRDRAGRILDYQESASLIVPRSKAPVYTTHEFNLGLGVVGGLILTGYDQGVAAAKMALRILQGEAVEDIPVTMSSPKHYTFDYRQMQRFQIATTDLPADSIVVNLPQSFYFKNKKWVNGVIVTFVVLLLIISILLYSIHKQRLAEKELKISQEQLRTLGWRLAETEDSQRKALSRELHDQIGQNLTILGVNLNILKSLLPEDTIDFFHSRIGDSLLIVKQTTERVRNIMNNLRSPVLDDYGLVAAIDLYGKQFTARTGLAIKVRGPQQDTHMPPHVENALFRIVQESLTNVLKHAKATEVVINIAVDGGKLSVSVEDDGIGYETDKLSKSDENHGWGLITMTERALAVGGTCRVQSSPGLGTHVIVEVPI